MRGIIKIFIFTLLMFNIYFPELVNSEEKMNQNVLNDVVNIIKFYGFKQYDGKIYGFFQTPQTPEVGTIREIDEDLSESRIVFTINRGKGPGEAQGCTDFVKLGDRWYVFDALMLRFNCYDDSGEFIDAYNLNAAVPIQSIFDHRGEIYCISIMSSTISIYKIEIKTEEVILSMTNSLKMEKPYSKLIRVICADTKQMVFIVNNTVFSLIKTNKKFLLKQKKLLGNNIDYYPVIINRNEKSFIYLFAKKYYKYDYEKNKITRVDEPDYEGTIVINGKKWVIKKEDDRLVKYLEELK